MASQRSGSRGGRQGQLARSSPTAPAAPASSRQATGSRKAPSGSGAPGRPKAAAAASGRTAAAAASASTPAGPPAGGPAGRLWSPFRQMGGAPLVTLILSLYGLGASIYLTIAHYDTAVTLVCSDKGLINCEEVTTSPESVVFGIFPVAVLGLAFYVFMVAVNSPWAWRLKSPAVRWARLGSVIVGMCFVLYLIYAEVDEIHAICLWCTSVHVATFLIFAVLVFYSAFSWEKPAAVSQR